MWTRAGKPRWADKNPENVLYLEQWQRLLGDSWLMIHVVRNPLDTLASIKEVEFPLTIPAGLEARIAFYLRYLEAGLRFGAAHPDRYCRVVYEQVVDKPRPVLDALSIPESWVISIDASAREKSIDIQNLDALGVDGLVSSCRSPRCHLGVKT